MKESGPNTIIKRATCSFYVMKFLTYHPYIVIKIFHLSQKVHKNTIMKKRSYFVIIAKFIIRQVQKYIKAYYYICICTEFLFNFFKFYSRSAVTCDIILIPLKPYFQNYGQVQHI